MDNTNSNTVKNNTTNTVTPDTSTSNVDTTVPNTKSTATVTPTVTEAPKVDTTIVATTATTEVTPAPTAEDKNIVPEVQATTTTTPNVLPADTKPEVVVKPVVTNPTPTVTPKVVEQDPKQSNTNVAGMDSVLVKTDIGVFLANPDMTPSEKIEDISKRAVGDISILASRLIDYNVKMSASIINEKAGAANNYDLYHTIMNVIGLEDYTDFKTKFDIINTAFRAYASGAYKETMLHRFDMSWKWGDNDLTTFQHIAVVIAYLCDLSKRKDNLKIIDINKALLDNNVLFKETMISNIKKYYNV